MMPSAMPPSAIPQFEHVVAAVHKPEIAAGVLEIAIALAEPGTGTVTAVYIPESDTSDLAYDPLTDLINHHRAAGVRIDLRPYPAESPARGILDAAREVGADVLVIGAQNQHDRAHPLGLTVENVATAAPCPVMIYIANGRGGRSRRHLPPERVVVPVDGDDHSRVGVSAAALVARSLEIPVEALHIARRGETSAENRDRLQQSTAHITDYPVNTVVLTAENPVDGLLTRIDRRDLLVIGFARRALLEKWLFGGFARRLLDKAAAPLLLVSELPTPESSTESERIGRRVIGWLVPRLTDLEHEDTLWRASQMAEATLDYIVLMALAGIISAAGLLLDSVALIIAAMIVAPMQQPITAFAIGLTTGRADLLRRAATTTLIGSGITLVIGALLSVLFGWMVTAPTGQMLAWSQPTLLDALIAAGAGAAGAYAVARSSVSEAIAGVAVATSLNPAISMIGIGITGEAEFALSGGALLLFVTNFICISLAGWGIFVWLGLRPKRSPATGRAAYWSFVALTVIALLVVVLLLGLRTRADETALIRRQLETTLTDSTVEQVRIGADGTTYIRVTAYTPVDRPITQADVAALEREIETLIARDVTLNVIVETLLTADESSAP
ncbi:MAG: TIGR00341 family protein [bacterium]|nr:TIGR00341 family protein [bacterium]